jgi:DNA-binding CsgD family transcriptional regulator
MSTVNIDCIAAVEACYSPASDDAEWLSGILATLRPLEERMPAAALTFRLDKSFRVGAVAASDPSVAPVYREMLGAVWERADVELVRQWYAPVPAVDLASERMRRLPPELVPQLEPVFSGTGVKDAIALLAREPDGTGVTLTFPYAGAAHLAPRSKSQLRRITAHLATSLRLRARTRGLVTPEHESVDAVLAPDGRVEHATGAAREAPARQRLASAVRDVEHARGTLRRTSPDEALALWEGLVNGRWSLVDHVESDGRRVILVRRNEPGARDPRALGETERDVLAYAALGHSNKHVAYMLGLAPTTVSTHLAKAMRKLGLKSRRELIELLGPLANPR